MSAVQLLAYIGAFALLSWFGCRGVDAAIRYISRGSDDPSFSTKGEER